MAIDKF